MNNWAILEISDLDYVAWWGVFDIEKLPDIKTISNELNQNEFASAYGYCLCTLYGILWSAYDNIKELSEEERKQLSKQRAEMDDFNPSVWGYISRGVDLVRKYYKKTFPNVTSIAIEVGSDTFYRALEKWYRLNIGLYIKEWYKEGTSDGVLVFDELWKKNRYWHSLSIKKIWDLYIVDNYKGIMPYNTFKIEDFKKFINEVFFKYAYLIYNPDRNMNDEIRKNIKLESARKAFDKNIWNGMDWDKPATREQVAAMIDRALELIK